MKSYAWCYTGRHYCVTHKLNTQWQHEMNKHFCDNNNQYWFSWTAYKCKISLICNKTFSFITNMKQHSQCFKRSLLLFSRGNTNLNNKWLTKINKSSWITCENQQICTSKIKYSNRPVTVTAFYIWGIYLLFLTCDSWWLVSFSFVNYCLE